MALELKLENGVGMVIGSKGYSFNNISGVSEISASNAQLNSRSESEELRERGQQAARARVPELPLKRRMLSIAGLAPSDKDKKSSYLNKENLSLHQGELSDLD